MELSEENVQDYPRPPALGPVPQTLRVMHHGQLIAQTDQGLRVLETHHAPTYYFPRDDILAALLPAAGASYCEWKGQATYWDIACHGAQVPKAGWSYPEPTKRFLPLKDHVAFYPGRFDEVWVGDVQATPQPGDFYGGWVTPNLLGIVKGDPETRHW